MIVAWGICDYKLIVQLIVNTKIPYNIVYYSKVCISFGDVISTLF